MYIILTYYIHILYIMFIFILCASKEILNEKKEKTLH